ncbi:MAG: NAD(P)/FAD-dependent oxidoreductase [Candidatus Spechtbacteria bacterium]|nr:NAD(P)/FAD-dependent oxidoreductase [Candidatus Spechtbacteria bacterium]
MKNIVIAGAGFAGIRVALKLEKKIAMLRDDWSIILIDKNSYHTYTPALYEAASYYHARLKKETSEEKNACLPTRLAEALAKRVGMGFDGVVGGATCLSIRTIIKNRNITFVEQEVSGVDFKEKIVKTKAGDGIPFEYLVLALGSEALYFGVKGAGECSYTLKSLPDALRIQSRIEELFLNAKAHSGNIEIVVAGAGASGVETAAEIATCARHLYRDYGIAKERARILLLEAQDKILTQVNPGERAKIKKRLQKLGVLIRTGIKINEVTLTSVVLESGEKCESSIVIWAGGVKGPSLFRQFENIELDNRGRIIVDAFLRVKNYSDIFALGDSSNFTDEKSGLTAPATAFIAEQQADIVAKNIFSSIRAEPLGKYHISIPGYAISCGGKYAVVSIFGVTFSGFLGWLIKRVIDLRYFLSLLPFWQACSLLLKEFRVFTKND